MRLSIQSISKSFGNRDLFRDFSLEVEAGSRLAVVGPNGTGKSTFLRIIAGHESVDSGRISLVPKETELGYAVQDLSEADLDAPLLDWVLEVLPSWDDFWEQWEQATKAGDSARLESLSHQQARWEHVHGYNPEHKAKAVLTGLGFEESSWCEPVRHLSGGWRERAKLTRVLLMGKGLLLLDEPTNHLDLEAVEWLENYLLNYEGILLFVAHDRIFLDRVATHVLALGGAKPVVRKGGLSEYQAWQKEQELQREREAKRLQQEVERKTAFVDRFRYKATKARQAQSQKKQVARLEKELAGLTPERKMKTLSFSWPEPKRGNQTVASAVDLGFSYQGEGSLWAPLNFQVLSGQKIGLVGPNGCGKSTLLKVLAGESRPTQGNISIGPAISIGYFSQHQSDMLHLDQTVLAEVRRLSDPKSTDSELMSVLGRFLLGQPYWDRQVSTLSGGEKNRLVLASLFLLRANFLILDEPTNHLDLESREALVASLRDYSGTVLMVAHDRYLLSEVPDQIWMLGEHGIELQQEGFWAYETQLKETYAIRPAEEETKIQEKAKRCDTKDQKRRQAEQRNRLYAALKPKKKAYAELEATLEKLLEQLGELEMQLSLPDIYDRPDELAELNINYASAQEEAEQLMERLAVLEKEMQDLQVGKDGLF